MSFIATRARVSTKVENHKKPQVGCVGKTITASGDAAGNWDCINCRGPDPRRFHHPLAFNRATVSSVVHNALATKRKLISAAR